MKKIAPVGDAVETDLNEIASALSDEPSGGTWSEVFRRDWRRPLMIGLGLAIFQQVTGINAIIYYADQIFGASGFAGSRSPKAVHSRSRAPTRLSCCRKS